MWTPSEIDEVKDLFKPWLKNKTLPKPKDVRKAMITSKEHNGEIHKRTKENIKKKIWNMIRK
jgi:hypothetical protein